MTTLSPCLWALRLVLLIVGLAGWFWTQRRVADMLAPVVDRALATLVGA